jgi:hypothetical protein
MYKLCFALVALVGCKEKQEAKPPPAQPPPMTGSEQKQPAPPPPSVAESAPPPAVAPAAPAVIKPAGGFNTAAEYEAKAFDVIDKLTAVFSRAGTNCDKLADGLELFVADHQTVFANTDAFEVANPAAKDALEAKMQEKARTFMQTANASMQACQKHQGVKDALAKLPD